MNPQALLRKLLFLPEAGTAFADSIDRLHFFVISVTMLGSLAVFAATLWFMLRYRRRGEPDTTPHIQASKKLEALVIGGLLATFILWWVIGFMQYIAYASPPSDAEDVYVTAKQWMWKFAYPDGKASVGALVVPANRKVRLVMTSRDVIHSFYVPAFRIKQDVLPARYTSVWFEPREAGVYDVYCAEFCGMSHSRMRASVVVLTSQDYERWLDGEEPELVARATEHSSDGGAVLASTHRTQSMVEAGRKAASRHGCFACHTIDGQPHIGPSWRGLFGSVVELERGRQVIADEEYLTRSMMDPKADIVQGFRPVMPTYQGSLRQPDAVAIVEFIKSLDEPAEPRVALPAVSIELGSASPAGTSPAGASTEPPEATPEGGSR